MKVCHIVRRFVKEQWGGTESVVYYLADEFERRSLNSPILTTSMFSQEGEESYGRVGIYRFSYIFPWFGLTDSSKYKLKKKGGSPLSFSLLSFLWNQKDASIIHTHSLHRLGGIARTVARLRGIPYVVTLHGGCLTLPTDQAEEMQNPFKGKLEWGKVFGFLLGSRRVLQDADAIICVGHEECELMKEAYPQKQVYYQPNGVATNFFSEADSTLFREQYNIREKEKIVLCVSRIDSQKNQLLLVKSFAQFKKTHQDYKLVLIGPVTIQAYRDKIIALAAEEGIAADLLLIPGLALEDPLLASAYKAAEIFVLPSHHEPFGIVILEAWAAGLPVIAADVGGISGFTEDGEDVVLFEDDNESQLVEALTSLAADDLLRNRIATNGGEKVKQYDWSEIAEQTLGIYNNLLGAERS